MQSGNILLFHKRFSGSIACVTMSAVKFWPIAKTTLKTEIKGGAGFESKLFICFYMPKNKILIVIHRKSYYAIKISRCLLGMKGFIK